MLDLCAVLDVSEDGMSLQSPVPLEVNRKLSFTLDFSETKSRIRAAGVVVWSDRSGRAGVRFEGSLPADAVQSLQEWLFVNALTAVAHHSAAAAANGLNSVKTQYEFEPPAAPDYTGMLAALAAVKREVETLGADLDASLRLIVERALIFTRASGAAIAIVELDNRIASPKGATSVEMICRARAGTYAPSLGARVQAGSGFSGECVRTGKLLRCDDAEIDPRVDQASCRALGVRSIVAVPVRSGNFVAGILEVFSPAPHAFNAIDGSTLMRLAETVSFAIHRAAQAMVKASTAQQGARTKDGAPPRTIRENDPDVPALFENEFDHPRLSRSRRILLFAVALTLLMVALWLVKTWPHSGSSPARASHPTTQGKTQTSAGAANNNLPVGINGIRQLAVQGDASAQFTLGVHYATGEDVPQDYSEAVRWFSMAAEQGQVMAQATLGAYYWAGRGVPQDLEKAYFWAMLAQAGGDDSSKVRVSFLTSRMTRAQILAAQQHANDWIKEHQIASSNSSASH